MATQAKIDWVRLLFPPWRRIDLEHLSLIRTKHSESWNHTLGVLNMEYEAGQQLSPCNDIPSFVQVERKRRYRFQAVVVLLLILAITFATLKSNNIVSRNMESPFLGSSNSSDNLGFFRTFKAKKVLLVKSSLKSSAKIYTHIKTNVGLCDVTAMKARLVWCTT